MDKELKDLKKQVEDLTLTVAQMQLELNKGTRDYTQNRTFTERVTFRGEVYNKAGTKVIN